MVDTNKTGTLECVEAVLVVEKTGTLEECVETVVWTRNLHR